MINRALHVFTLLYGLNCGHVRPGLRIYGGEDADMGKFPFAVLLELRLQGTHEGVEISRYGPFCSGTALSSTWTLTASHCIDAVQGLVRLKSKSSEKQLLFIRYNTTGEPQRKRILKLILNPNFNNEKNAQKDDIGLLKTDDIQLPFYAKLSSVDYTTLIGQEAIYLGYGDTHTQYEENPGRNSTLKMMTVMLTKCDNSYIKATPSMCSVPKCGVREFLCPGDSGGTVLHSSGVVGVHSGSIGCFLKQNNPIFRKFNYAGINVPVSPYIDWIRSEIIRN